MSSYHSALKIGYFLNQFELKKILGHGGFSIVYLAKDHNSNKEVAIKEYFPQSIAFRDNNGFIRPSSKKNELFFDLGFKSFLNEFKILKKFNNSSIVKIIEYFEKNLTAYTVMPFYNGKNLSEFLKKNKSIHLDEHWIIYNFLIPLLDAIDALHQKNYCHLDLSPDNIIIQNSEVPVIIDFGSAKNIKNKKQVTDIIINKHGFSPIEKYTNDLSFQLGPWTDIYGIGAILYYMITKKYPTSSINRLSNGRSQVANIPSIYRSSLSTAMKKSLAFNPFERPQSIKDLKKILFPLGCPNLNYISQNIKSEFLYHTH